MRKIYLILFFVGLCSCSANDQKHWHRIQSLICGNRPQITDHQLSQMETQCKITKEEDGPISSCADNKLENNRDIMEALCNPKTFPCIQDKPLLSASELQSTERPDQLKEQLVGCIENVIKYNHYLFDDKINFN